MSAGVGATGARLIWRHDHELSTEKQRLLVEHAAFGFDSNMRVVARELLRLSKLPEMSDLRQNRQLLYSAHQNSIFFSEVRIIAADGGVSLVQPEHAEGALAGLNDSDRTWFERTAHCRAIVFCGARALRLRNQHRAARVTGVCVFAKSGSAGYDATRHGAGRARCEEGDDV